MMNFFNQISSVGGLTNVDLWLVAGQSNTDGRVPIAEPPTWLGVDNKVPNTKMFNDITNTFDDWMYGVNGGGDNNVDLRWAYDSTAIKSYANLKSKRQYVVKNTRGGTSIGLNPIVGSGCWNVDFNSITNRKLLQELEDKYKTAVLVLNNLGYNPIVKGLLWHQGESDSSTVENQNSYYQNFKDVIYYVRNTIVGNTELPIVFGSISHASAQYSSVVETAQFQIASEDDNAYIVDMQNGTLLDPYHFDDISSEFLGEGMYDIIKNF